MAVQLFDTETRYVANELTFVRGTVDDVVSVGVYHNVDPNVVPAVADFVTVQLVQPPEELAEGTKIDVLSLIGPDVPADLLLAPGVYQRWVLVTTGTEKLIYKVDMVTVIG